MSFFGAAEESVLLNYRIYEMLRFAQHDIQVILRIATQSRNRQ
jgi:hypothetical protein